MGKAARIAGTVVLWLLSVPLALVMLIVGWAKIVGSAPWPTFFADFGYSGWFMVLVGLCQLGGGIAVVIPRFAAYGGALITVVMAGATVTEMTREGGFPSPLVPALFTAVAFGITVARSRQLVARRRSS